MTINPKQKSNLSICYSFSSRWFQLLTTSQVNVFFRKVRPVREPKITFFYVGTPYKHIAGFAQIKKIETVDLEQAKSIRNDGAISEDELETYFGNKTHVNAIWIENHQFFKKPFDLHELRLKFGISAPQNFCNVSANLEAFLMEDHL